MPVPATTPGRETRTNPAKIELRAADAATPRTLTGYAAVFGTETDICDCWIEQIAPGAFARSIANMPVVALHSHDPGRVIGSTAAGTLRLKEDERGLAVEIDLPDTGDGRDLAVLIERGDIAGMSFGFATRKQTWDDTTTPPRRTIEDVDLYEVTITAFPAYPDTSIGLRSLEAAKADETTRRWPHQWIALRAAMLAQKQRGLRVE